MNRKIFFTLILITLVSFFLRFIELDKRPMTLNRDEAALAYNGYLLALTGKDEWQKSWPLALESFGDYKLLGYPFFLSLLFQLLPANDIIVKIPSILAGTFLPLIAYFFVKELFNKSKNVEIFALITSFLVATSPIFIFYSRTAFESNLALSFTVLAMTLLLSAINNEHFSYLKIILGTIVFFFATITYNTPLLILPFFVTGLCMYFNKKILKKISIIVVSLLIIFTSVFLILAPLTAQKSSITIFSDALTRHNYIEYRNKIYQDSNVLSSLVSNRYVFYSQIIFSNIMNSFSYKFLVSVGGQHPWHNIPNQAHIFAIVYSLSIFGITIIVLNIFTKLLSKNFTSELKSQIFTLYLCITSLAPAVITVDAPHATRSLFFIFILVILASYATIFILNEFQNVIQKKSTIITNLTISLLVLIISVQTFAYMNRYLNDDEIEHKKRYLVGFEKVVKESFSRNITSEIAVVDPDGYQYILLAWYLKVQPEDFFSTVVKQQPNRIGFRYGEKVLNYHFIANENDRSENEQLMLKWNDKINDWELL